ncbi:hypothetical protein [Sphingomonas sp.]|uniref:hypothetical protein n=1 Tax=Sphingomonas sp. TaxID=28214 RepID=UPI003B00F460
MDFKFRIFGESSNHGFTYRKDNLPSLNELDMMNAIMTAATGDLTLPGMAKTAFELRDPTASDVGKAAGMVGNMVFAELIQLNIMNLAKKSGGHGWVGLWTWEHNIIMKDQHRFTKVTLGGDNPGLDFMRKIKPTLEAAGMSNLGVLNAIGMALSKYDEWIGDGQPPSYSIQIKKG